MRTGYLYSKEFLEHTQVHHPENRRRLEAVMGLLDETGILSELAAIPFNALTDDKLSSVHHREYIDRMRQLSDRGGGMFGPDTYVTTSTYRVAALAAGAAVAAVSAVLHNTVTRAMAIVRPPGHHAHPDHAEGFCIFNNVALAAMYALGRMSGELPAPLDRVMIIDWDVHHGNGSEAVFYADPAVLYLSTHQSPLYPGTGRITDTGSGPGRGYNVNIPLPPGVGDRGYERIFRELVVPAARRYQPQLILVSAGFDAHWRDELAGMFLSLTGMASLMSIISTLSNELCQSRLVVVLEGGYDLEVLSYGVLNTLRILLDQNDIAVDPPGAGGLQETSVDSVIRKVRQVHGL